MPDRYGKMDWRDRDRDWRDRDERHSHQDHHERRASDKDPLEDYGQADFSRDYAYDPSSRTGYRVDPREEARRRAYERDDRDAGRDYLMDREPRYEDQRHRPADYDRDADGVPDRYEDRRDDRRAGESRSFSRSGGLGALFGGRETRGENDRVLWVVATEALHKARGIDASDIDVHVEQGVITLNGTVRSREEKRRVEDLVEQRGVRDVQNNLRIRERRFF